MDSTRASMETDVNKVIDGALEKLRWCREHMHERGAAEALRELEARLGYLAQALTWELDGDARAAMALNLALGRSRRPAPHQAFFDPHDPHSWGMEWWHYGH
jgi:hypothetical protein